MALFVGTCSEEITVGRGRNQGKKLEKLDDFWAVSSRRALRRGAYLDDVLVVDPEVVFVADLLVIVVDGDDDLVACDQLHLGVDPGLHDARPDLGTLRVQSDADRHADVGGRLPDVVDRLQVVLVRAVREVHTRYVQTCAQRSTPSSSSSSSFNFKKNGTIQNKAAYEGNMGQSLRHRKVAHSTNTWPEVHTTDITVQLQ